MRTLLILTLIALSSVAKADIEWSGLYRIEAYNLKNMELGSDGRELNYGLSHLILRPRIIAGDGLTIQGQFHIFNNPDYPNSQMGQWFGSGVRDRGAAAPTSNDGSNTMSNQERAETITVSQLYLTYSQEFGSLVVGRVPLNFGLGVVLSGGRGLFDHWYDSSDLVGYKIVLGNLFIMPMLGRKFEGRLNDQDDLTDYMVQVQYENPESDMQMGAFYRERHGGLQATADDIPVGAGLYGGAGATATRAVATKLVSIYALKDSRTYRLGVEFGFHNGPTGVEQAGADVSFNAFGLGAEAEYRPEGSSWKWGLKGGVASGDNPTTNNTWEGFTFNRNYDVAMLMFNQPMGRDDFFRTQPVRGNVSANNSINRPDVDAISNVLYLAPRVTYGFNDNWSMDGTFITGFLATNPLVNQDPGKSLGYEVDLALNYAPRKGVVWINQIGMMFPGGVWRGGGQYDSSFAYGLGTKAAISF